jgi:predicted N-acetyltransferase YhbS
MKRMVCYGGAPLDPDDSYPQHMSAPDIIIRQECLDDTSAVSRVTIAAFLAAPHTSHTEHFIIEALRKAGKLTVSRVATHNEEVVGHVAASPIEIDGTDEGWYGLGPVSVLAGYRHRGIGSALVMDALLVLSSAGAAGCVVLGDPGFYERFGFKASGSLRLAGVPAEYFMAVAFDASMPSGDVSYHEAFHAQS